MGYPLSVTSIQNKDETDQTGRSLNGQVTPSSLCDAGTKENALSKETKEHLTQRKSINPNIANYAVLLGRKSHLISYQLDFKDKSSGKMLRLG
jgi:hypothetical protein